MRSSKAKPVELGEEAAAAAPPRSPTRVMAILETLAQENLGLPLARLCERLDQPKSTLLSILRALEEEGYVVNRQGLYRLGDASLRLAALVSSSFPFPGVAHEHLVRLRDRVEESVFMAVLSDDLGHAVYVDKVETTRPLRYAVAVGTHRPLYSTAIGRALLAFQPQSFIDGYLRAQDFIGVTRIKPMDAATIDRELEKVRKSGVSVAFGEHTESVGAYAAPVFGADRSVRGAVSVAGPTSRMREQAAQFKAAVCETAATLSHLLGARA